MNKPTIVPFVKWVGGKRQLLSEIEKVIDKLSPFKNYHEPFVGGGAVFMHLLSKSQKYSVKTINDMNSQLINCYEVIRDKPLELIKLLKNFESNHTKLFYYLIRYMDKEKDFYKKDHILKAARFIYLNKTSFNGIYRVNSKNEFNVPIGAIGKVSIFDEKNILNLSNILKNSKTKFFNNDYSYVLKEAKQGDLVYFDPPYDSFENKNNFVGYQKDGFDRQNQKELKELCDKLISKKVKVIISNHNTKFIKELYSDKKYKYYKIPVSVTRALNSNGEDRAKKKIEVIIYGGLNEQ